MASTVSMHFGARLCIRHIASILLLFNIYAFANGYHRSTVAEDLLYLPNSIPVSYHEIKKDLILNSRQPLPFVSAKFALDSFTPFCKDYKRPEPEANVRPECVRWEVSTTIKVQVMVRRRFGMSRVKSLQC